MTKRQFDGGLLTRRSYSLTRVDALAALRLRRELPQWAKIALGVYFMAGGAASGLLPDGWAGPPDSLRSVLLFLLTIALLSALLMGAREVWLRLKAWRMLPRPQPALLEEWQDCLAGTLIGDSDETYLPPHLISQILTTPTHLFIISWRSVIVVPNRAFEDSAAKDRFATRWQEAMRDSHDPED